MKSLLFVFTTLLMAGCASVKRDVVAPTVSTAQVIQSLTDAKTELKEAGDQNTVVAQKIDKALTLAERLDVLLEQIEQEANKNIVKPE